MTYTDSPQFTSTASYSKPLVIEAGVTGFLFDYPCIPREARKSRIYIDWDPDWSSVRTRLAKPPTLSLLLFFILLLQLHVQERHLDTRCCFCWCERRRGVRPSCTLQAPLATKLTAGQTHRYCMYTSFDVFQAVSTGQSSHKTYGELFSGCAISAVVLNPRKVFAVWSVPAGGYTSPTAQT